MTPRPYAYAFEEHGAIQPELFLERASAERRAASARGGIVQLWTHPPIDDKRLQRAVEIADENMLRLIRDNCIKADETGRRWDVPDDCDLVAELHDAIAWLADRGLITMTPNATILLLVASEEI